MDPDPDRRPDARHLLSALGGTTRAAPVTLHLPHDLDPGAVDVTTLLPRPAAASDVTDPLRRPTRPFTSPVRELATAASGPRAPLAAQPLPPAWASAPAPPGDGPPPGGTPPDDDAGWDWPPDDTALEPYDDRTGLDAEDRAGDDGDDALRRSPARGLQAAVTGAAAVGVVGAATLVAPVVGALAVLLVLVLLRATGRAGDRLRDRRERRGLRRRDPVVLALTSPWHLVLALGDTLLSLPLLLVCAAVPAGVVWLASPSVSGLEVPELTTATAAVAALLVGLGRRVHAPSRRLLRGALRAATPGAAGAVAVAIALAAIALVLLATAEGAGAVWWPLQDAPAALPQPLG